MEPVLEELKESARESIETKQRALSELAKESKDNAFDSAEFRDVMRDILSRVRTEYQLTVAEAKTLDDIDQIAELWKETHAYYSGMLSMWQGMNALLGGNPKDELFGYWGEVGQKNKRPRMSPQLDKLSYRVSAHCPNCQAVTSFDGKHAVIAGGPMVLKI